MDDSMNIVIAINKAYIRYAYVMLKSLLIHNSSQIQVYVFHHDLSNSDEPILKELETCYPVTLHYVYVSDDYLPPKEALEANSWGIETYFRLLLTDLLPTDIHRALYIDSDMIINGSIKEFYAQELSSKKLAACKDFTSQPPFGDYRDDIFKDIITADSSYFNAGFTLFHLDALRQEFDFKRYMDVAKQLDYRIQFPDQDLLNYCHHDDVKLLDPFRYNLYARRAYTDYNLDYSYVKEHVTVVHFATSKPWQGNCFHCDIEQLWWDYAKMTPFYTDFLEQMVKETISDSTIFQYASELESENKQLYQITEQYDTILKAYNIQI